VKDGFSVTVKSCKAKARVLQNFIVEQFVAAFPTLECHLRPALMGEQGVDIQMTGAAHAIIPFGIEAKNVERVNIWAAYDQAVANAKRKGYANPAVIIKKNRVKDPLVIIPFSAFLKLLVDLNTLQTRCKDSAYS